jgi:spore maturation protein CgeB
MKKILYIGFRYEYGKKELGSSLNYLAWFKNFNILGYKVKGIFYEQFSNISILQKKIISTSLIFKPDLIFFILQEDQVKVETLKILKKKNFFTVNFFGDDDWRFENFSSVYSKYFSAVLTNTKFAISKHFKIGQKKVLYCNWAALDSFKCKKIFSKYIYDVSFVGGRSRYRKWFINELLKRNINVKCFGQGWRNGFVTFKKMNEIFSHSKISLNISNSYSYDARFIFSSIGNFLSFIMSFFKKTLKYSNEIKARNFEICYCGGFQITDYVPFLENNFVIGKEIVTYNNLDDAAKLIKYYLINERDREIIRLKGNKRALRDHSYQKRIKIFMKTFKRIKSKTK